MSTKIARQTFLSYLTLTLAIVFAAAVEARDSGLMRCTSGAAAPH